MSELKPCPFCGGEAYTVERGIYGWSIECDTPFCPCDFALYRDEAEAIEAWNTRADDYRQAAEYWQRMYEDAFAEPTCKNVDDEFPFFKCSECGCYAVVGYGNSGDGLPKYCPNCGAKVIGGNE